MWASFEKSFLNTNNMISLAKKINWQFLKGFDYFVFLLSRTEEGFTVHFWLPITSCNLVIMTKRKWFSTVSNQCSSKFPNLLSKLKRIVSADFELKMEGENPLNPLQLTLTGFCFVFVLVGIVSNIAMILNFKQKDLTIRFNSLIILCAVFDLITICTFALTTSSYFIKGPVVIFLFVFNVAFNCSALTMTTIALERYLVLCKNK